MIRAEYEIGGEAVVQSWLLWRVAAVGSYKGTPTPKLGLATVLGNIRTVHIPEVHGSSTLYRHREEGTAIRYGSRCHFWGYLGRESREGSSAV